MSRWYSSVTQIAWACLALIKGRIISTRTEFREANGYRLPAIICQLKHKYSWNIKTIYKSKTNKTGYYKLICDNPRSLKLPESCNHIMDEIKEAISKREEESKSSSPSKKRKPKKKS